MEAGSLEEGESVGAVEVGRVRAPQEAVRGLDALHAAQPSRDAQAAVRELVQVCEGGGDSFKKQFKKKKKKEGER